MNCPITGASTESDTSPQAGEARCPLRGIFTPPYPRPLKKKSSGLFRLAKGWYSWIHMLFEKSYRMKLGDVSMPHFRSYIANEPALVKRIMRDEADRFPKHWLMHKILSPLLGESIFTTNGEVWKRQRRMMDVVFEVTKLQRVFPLMQDSVDAMLARTRSWERRGVGEIDEEMTHVTADIIFRTILSQPLEGEDARTIYRAFIRYQEMAHKVMMLTCFRLPTFWHWRQCRRSAHTIRRLLMRLIAARYRAYLRLGRDPHDDLLTALMETTDPETGDRFDEQELVDQISIMFLAGHETSATSLTWALYLVSKSPPLQQRIADEHAAITAGEPLAFRHVNKLKTAHDLFREALRLYPPVGFFLREAAEDTTLRDKQVEQGAAVMVSPWLLHRHRELWENPDAFDPDRFRREADKDAIRTVYMPFGSGPRTCIGKAFATQEAILILSTLISTYEFTPAGNREPEPVGRVTIRPENGVRLRVRRREPSGITPGD